MRLLGSVLSKLLAKICDLSARSWFHSSLQAGPSMSPPASHPPPAQFWQPIRAALDHLSLAISQNYSLGYRAEAACHLWMPVRLPLSPCFPSPLKPGTCKAFIVPFFCCGSPKKIHCHKTIIGSSQTVESLAILTKDGTSMHREVTCMGSLSMLFQKYAHALLTIQAISTNPS